MRPYGRGRSEIPVKKEVLIVWNSKSTAPIILMLALFIFVPALNASTVGIMVPVGVVFTVIVARILYKKGVL